MLKTDTTTDRLVLIYRPVEEIVVAIAATALFAVLAAVLFAIGNDAGVIFLVFAVSGPVYIYFFVETRKITLDRPSGTVTISTRTTRATATASHPLAGIARAEMHRATPQPDERAVDAELAMLPRGSYRTVLLYENGTELPLSDGYTRGKIAVAETRAINAWLD